MFKVYNVRLGFATNSSSAHSMILIPDASLLYDDTHDALDGHYGRQYFTLVSEKAKRLYLAGQVYMQLERTLGEQAAAAMTYAYIGEHWQGGEEYDWDDFMFIDHQSEWSFPQSWHGEDIDQEFLEAVKEFVLHKDLIILGGSDETDPHPLIRAVPENKPFRVPFWGGWNSLRIK